MAKTVRKTTKKQASKPKAAPRRQSKNVETKTIIRHVRARYDSAQNDPENRKHWASADGLSAASANTIAVRRTLRNRARYEVANNSYARGIVNTIANHVIGTGPRLQVETGAEDPKIDEEIEASFAKWARAVNLGAKLKTMQVAKRQDGEAFAILRTNDNIDHPVKLDLQLVECDRVTTPFAQAEILPGKIDGIDFDSAGNPITYHVLRYHPGDAIVYNPLETDAVSADLVLHWFRSDRPGQYRGIPEITPALPLFAQLRRWTLATLSAAEAVANISLAAVSTASADPESAPEDFEEVEFNRNTMVAMPFGYDLKQVSAEQPTSTYKEFKWEILNEISRCLDMPFNIAACNSSGYNYSSGRLDHQTYYRGVTIEQCDCEHVILCRVFAAWAKEAMLASASARNEVVDAAMYGDPTPAGPFLSEAIPPYEEWSVGWFWDGQESADALKDAAADEQNLANGTTNEAEIIARNGGDWRKVMRKRAEILKYKQELETEYGVKFPTDTAPAPSPFGGDPNASDPNADPNADTNTPPPKKKKKEPAYAPGA